MGKPAEASDDLAMPDCKIQKTFEHLAFRRLRRAGQEAETLHCQVLQLQVFGVLERQVEKHSFYRTQERFVAQSERGACSRVMMERVVSGLWCVTISPEISLNCEL